MDTKRHLSSAVDEEEDDKGEEADTIQKNNVNK